MSDGPPCAEDLVDILVTILQGAPNAVPPVPPPTDALAADVQPYRDWSIQALDGPFTPKITFDLPREEREGLSGRNGGFQSNTVAVITLRAFVCAQSAAAPGGDGGEVRVRTALRSLRRQILLAVVNNPILYAAGVQQIRGIRSELQADKDSNGFHLGQLGMQFALEFYEGPEDFFPLEFDDLEEMHIDVTLGEDTVPAASLDLTLSDNT